MKGGMCQYFPYHLQEILFMKLAVGIQHSYLQRQQKEAGNDYVLVCLKADSPHDTP